MENPKTSMAKITLHKIVEELSEEGSIKKIPDGKQKIQLTAFTEEIDETETNYKEIDKTLKKFEKYYFRLVELSKDKSVSSTDFSRLIYRFIKSFWFLDWKCKSNYMPIKFEEKKRLEKIEEMKNKLTALLSEKNVLVNYSILISNELTSDMSNEEIMFTDELEEYENE